MIYSGRSPSPVRTQDRERGSALLIVFLLAALIAIMLYKAAPAVVFEAQRQKEQLLIDRGNEYKRGIKLFYVRNKTFPTSLDQLEKFNNMRFIRHRFKDPMSGKAEWRIIHVMGPGFMLTDSKVNPMPVNPNQPGAGSSGAFNQNGATSNNANNAAPNSTSGSAFGSNNATGAQQNSPPIEGGPSTTEGGAPPQPTAAQLYGAQRRPPSIAAASYVGPVPAEGENPQDADANNLTQDANNLTTQDDNNPGLSDDTTGNEGAQPENVPDATVSIGAGPAGRFGPGMRAGRNMSPGMAVNPGGNPNAPPPGAASTMPQPGDSMLSNENSPGAAGMNAVNSSLRKPTQQASTTGTTSSMGIINAGAIAGVASTTDASSIKILDKQTNYMKWEFVYNPQKEAMSGMAGAAASMMNGANPANQGRNGTAFGNNSGSAFNNGSNSGSAFNNGSNSGSAFNNGSSSFNNGSSNNGSASNNNSSGSTNNSNNGSSFNNSDNGTSSQPPPQ